MNSRKSSARPSRRAVHVPRQQPSSDPRNALHLIGWVTAIVAWALTRNGQPVLVNGGVLAGGLGLVLFGLYSYQAGFDLEVDERDALVAATRTVGFAVGHASAQLGWRGLRSRPTWRILVYSSEEPPTKRGLVLVDGVRGDVLQHFVEDNPEDWTQLSET